MAPAPSRPSSTSTFLALPPELRLQIYTHALAPSSTYRATVHSLLLTNHQIRHEATKPFFDRMEQAVKEKSEAIEEEKAEPWSITPSYSDEFGAEMIRRSMRLKMLEMELKSYERWQARVVEKMAEAGFPVEAWKKIAASAEKAV